MKKTTIIIALMLSFFIAKSQTTQLQTPYCGYQSISPVEFIKADSILTATDYKFLLVNSAASFTQTAIGSGYPYMQFYSIPSMSLNTTFTVSVAWSSDNGATWSPYGSTCTITSPINATTQLSSGYCSSIPATFTTAILCDVTGSTNYEFQLINSALSYTQSVVRTNANFYFAMFTGLITGATYSINIRTKIFGNWDIWGPTCTITTPGVPITQLSTGSCGSSPASYSTGIFADAVGGASQYEYMIYNTAATYTQNLTRNYNNFTLGYFTGLNNTTTYSVQVRAFVSSTWGSFGVVCNITSPSTPSTQLSSGSCNSSPATYTTALFADAVTGATQYEYQLINSSLSYTQTLTRSNPNFYLAMFTGLTASTNYSAQVRAFANNSWGNFGTICTVLTPTIPTSKLTTASCGSSPASGTTAIFCDAVTGASQYEYRIYSSALSYTQTLDRSNANFYTNMFTGMQTSSTYSVDVRVQIGTSWSVFGAICTINTPSSFRLMNPSYPNPFTKHTEFSIITDITEHVNIKVYDKTGKVIDNLNLSEKEFNNIKIGDEYPSGLYNVILSQNNEIKSFKIIKN